MIKIEAKTLEDAYSKAAGELGCSVTELVVEVVQYPSGGILGLFRKNAVIVATIKPKEKQEETPKEHCDPSQEEEETPQPIQEAQDETTTQPQEQEEIVPPSFVEAQEEVQSEAEEEDVLVALKEVVKEIKRDINELFAQICFDIEPIIVDLYDENTIYIEINGADAALLIGKEGYRYKALSYMLFNWINAKYGLQLRLEIAEFLQNQEEAVRRYLEGVKESIDRDGRAQTKILDGVLVQIALRELREAYPQKYVAIRTTRDGLKYIIVNDYNY